MKWKAMKRAFEILWVTGVTFCVVLASGLAFALMMCHALWKTVVQIIRRSGKEIVSLLNLPMGLEKAAPEFDRAETFSALLDVTVDNRKEPITHEQ